MVRLWQGPAHPEHCRVDLLRVLHHHPVRMAAIQQRISGRARQCVHGRRLHIHRGGACVP